MRDDVRLEIGRSGIEYLGSAGLDDWTVTLCETGEDTMTGGRVRAIRKYVEGDEPWFLTYGDGLADIELKQLLQFHRQHGKVATVSGVFPSGRYGEIRATDGGTVSEFDEKPMEGDTLVSGGFFVLDGRRIWDYLEGNESLVFEREPMRRLVAAQQLMVRAHQGYWQAMDTLREYLLLNDMWNKGRAPWKVW
jgi:glucose-1-phosphate cytidylyltransferase